MEENGWKEREMARIYDVAEWFQQKEPMSHKRIQKLCYYAQAWSCALLDKKLDPEAEFQAWIHGPVCRDLYEKYKGHGWNNIEPENKALVFSASEKDLLESVWLTYKDLSANELEVLSHSEKPWKEARRDCDPDERCEQDISFESMRDYYRSIYIGDC